MGLFGGEEGASSSDVDAVEEMMDGVLGEVRLMVGAAGISKSKIGARAGHRGIVPKMLLGRNPLVRSLARVARACGRKLVIGFVDSVGRHEAVDDHVRRVLRDARALLLSIQETGPARVAASAATTVGEIDAILGRSEAR